MNADLFLASCPLFAWSDRHSISSSLGPDASSSSCQESQHGGGTTDGQSSPVGTTCFTTSIALVVTLLSLLYIFLALLTNLIACYNFVVAWNLITRMYHVDLTFISRRYHHHNNPHLPPRRSTSSNLSSSSQPSSSTFLFKGHLTSSSYIHADGMKDVCCPVCLEDFYEQESVTACEDGCGAWFHKECLLEWLDRSDSCPCCRRDLVSSRPRSWCHDLTVFLGYASQ